jgi:hypothetical protein
MNTFSASTQKRTWLGSRRIPAIAAAGAVLALSLAVWAAGETKKDAGPATEPVVKKAADAGPEAKPDTVRIYFQTIPPRKAVVKWGRKTLGVIPAPHPLVVERTRDSGPLDVVIRASGFLPVHTRANTFSDTRLVVKLTPPLEKSKLFGYKQEVAPNPDAGVPEPLPPLGPAVPPAPAAPTPLAPSAPPGPFLP